jgi:hypothetical protein
VFSAQADSTSTHTSHKDTEQGTIEASITLDGVTLTDPVIRWSPNEWPSVCRDVPVSADKMFWTSNKPAKLTPYIQVYISQEQKIYKKKKLRDIIIIFRRLNILLIYAWSLFKKLTTAAALSEG